MKTKTNLSPLSSFARGFYASDKKLRLSRVTSHRVLSWSFCAAIVVGVGAEGDAVQGTCLCSGPGAFPGTEHASILGLFLPNFMEGETKPTNL